MTRPKMAHSAGVRRISAPTHALTWIEVVLVIGSLAILAALMLPMFAKARSHRRIPCISNVKSLALYTLTWSIDSGKDFANLSSTNEGGTREFLLAGGLSQHFRSISNPQDQSATPARLVCVADDRQAAHDWSRLANTNISYFVNLDAGRNDPGRVLLGDRGLTNSGPPGAQFLYLGTNDVPDWTARSHAGRGGNLAFADGSGIFFEPGTNTHSAFLRSCASTDRLVMPW